LKEQREAQLKDKDRLIAELQMRLLTQNQELETMLSSNADKKQLFEAE
jgi:hypothetical protein